VETVFFTVSGNYAPLFENMMSPQNWKYATFHQRRIGQWPQLTYRKLCKMFRVVFEMCKWITGIQTDIHIY